MLQYNSVPIPSPDKLSSSSLSQCVWITEGDSTDRTQVRKFMKLPTLSLWNVDFPANMILNRYRAGV